MLLQSTVSSSGKVLAPWRVVLTCSAVHPQIDGRSEEHTSELQSRLHLVCRLLLEKKKKKNKHNAKKNRLKTNNISGMNCLDQLRYWHSGRRKKCIDSEFTPP